MGCSSSSERQVNKEETERTEGRPGVGRGPSIEAVELRNTQSPVTGSLSHPTRFQFRRCPLRSGCSHEENGREWLRKWVRPSPGGHSACPCETPGATLEQLPIHGLSSDPTIHDPPPTIHTLSVLSVNSVVKTAPGLHVRYRSDRPGRTLRVMLRCPAWSLDSPQRAQRTQSCQSYCGSWVVDRG